MILIIGPTPAFQSRMTLSSMEMGKPNRAMTTEFLAAGKGINCARAIKQLGEIPHVLMFSGGVLGQAVDQSLKAENIPFTSISTHSQTRHCCSLLDQKSGSTTEFIENAGPVTTDEIQALKKKCFERLPKATALICIGSLPQNAPADLYFELIEKSHQIQIPVIVDAQKEALLKAATAKPAILKINREEMETALGISTQTDSELHSAMNRLQSMGPQYVIVTQEEKPVHLTDGKKIYRFSPPEIRLGNPLGSGDCMAAGIIIQWIKGSNIQDAVKFGMACGSANASGRGYGYLSLTSVSQYLPQIHEMLITP